MYCKSELGMVTVPTITLKQQIFKVYTPYISGRDCVVGTATRYGLDGPGIESRWGVRFSAPVQTGPGAHPASCTMGNGTFPGVKRPGRGVDYLPHPAPSLKKEYSYTSTPPLGLHGLF
jgi:hypothetical protein